ncbi:hypothetical protein BN1050_02616 [Metalysinibacillus saudimassiliensis]|uniref:Uncharacterized protein n=1 Tax=Metalysinibacillus saudimassiliensis TaxID=1461583 RepID=A0A078MEH0_9BACL|nr:hypothetical protein BN1050_02616 [Metalysinibacillus saudimassiliensis]
MNIVVTVPKSDTRRFEQDINNCHHFSSMFNWVLSKYPKKLKRGDKIYFVVNGLVAYSADFLYHERKYIYFNDERKLLYVMTCLNPTENPLEEMKGFQGFRYYEPPAIKKEKPADDADLPF